MAHPTSPRRWPARLTPSVVRLLTIFAVLLGILGAPLPTMSGSLASVASASQTGESVKAVATGWKHTCVLMSTGTVRCWGDNKYGQIDVPADLAPVSQVSVGITHTCAVTDGGTVRCWGDNRYGLVNVPADLGPVSQVSAGMSISNCAVLTTGAVRCWGGRSAYEKQPPANLGSFNQVSTSIDPIDQFGVTCAATTVGAVRCWVWSIGGDEVNPTDLGPVSQISVGSDNGFFYVCAVRTDSTVRCWSDAPLPAVPADLGPVIQVSAGEYDTCAITTANILRCWGRDGESEQAPIPADLGPVSQVSVGWDYACAVTTAGGVRCWGDDTYGQIVTLTPNSGGEVSPSPISASGEIAYVQDGNIYLLDLANSQATPLVTDGTVGVPGEWRGGIQLTWSPDGRRLAYASNRAGNYDIYVLDVASGSTEQISSGPQDEYLPDFAPDGTLFFVQITQAHEHNSVVGEWDLIRVTTPGQEAVVAADSYVVDKIDVLAADNVMMISSADMSWGRLATGKEDVVWNNDNYNCAWPGGGQSTFDAAWSRDSATLAVIAADCPPGDTSGDWRTATLLIDAANPNTEPRRLVGGEQLGSSLDWSPDNAWLVYGGGGLWLVRANGGTPQQISEVGENPAWRPAVTGGNVTPTVAPTATPQPLTPTISSNAAASYILSGHVVDANGNPARDVLIYSDTCGSTTTDANGEYGLTWYATQPEHCTVRLYQQNVPAEGWGAVFDPPVYTFTTQNVEEKNFTMRTKRRPLIFVPGIMGSKLSENGHELWPLLGAPKERLSLNPQDNFKNNQIIATNVIRDALFEMGINYHGPFVDGIIYQVILHELIVQGGYREYKLGFSPLSSCEQAPDGTSLFVFAYDWRKSNAENSNDLRDYINCVRKRTGSGYVDVVAHSMGGILTRRYVLDNRSNHHIDRFISIATPWLGAPRAIAIMETGQYPGVTPAIIGSDSLKSLVEYFPGAHELLPSPTYFNRSGIVFGEYGWDYNQNGNSYEYYTPENFVSAFDQRFNSKPGSRSRDFHTNEQDNLSEWHGVDHYNIYGNIEEQNTIATILSADIPFCETVGGWIAGAGRKDVEVVCQRNDKALFLTLSSGDGTVPVISAVPPPLEAPKDCNDYNLHLACFLGNKDQVNHNALVRNEEVIADVIKILSRRSPAPPVAVVPGAGEAGIAYSTSFRAMAPQAETSAVQSAHYITILNTPSVTLADSFGNTTDAISGTLSMPVPNASYYILGERAHMFVAPADQEYTLTLPVSQTPMYLELRTGTGDTTSSTIRYRDLSFPLTTTAMLAISPQGIAELRYDSDGDGSFDTIVPPTVSVSGDTASDAEPPTVSITVDRQGGRWMATISAEDAGSGVKQVLYSTDDQRYQIYTEPFKVNPNEVSTLYAFADDNLANRSGVVNYTLSRAVPLGMSGNIGIVLILLVLIAGTSTAGYFIAKHTPYFQVFLAVVVGVVLLLLLGAFVLLLSLSAQPNRSADPITPTAQSSPDATYPTASAPALPSIQPTQTSVRAPTSTIISAYPTSGLGATATTGDSISDQ